MEMISRRRSKSNSRKQEMTTTTTAIITRRPPATTSAAEVEVDEEEEVEEEAGAVQTTPTTTSDDTTTRPRTKRAHSGGRVRLKLKLFRHSYRLQFECEQQQQSREQEVREEEVTAGNFKLLLSAVGGEGGWRSANTSYGAEQLSSCFSIRAANKMMSHEESSFPSLKEEESIATILSQLSCGRWPATWPAKHDDDANQRRSNYSRLQDLSIEAEAKATTATNCYLSNKRIRQIEEEKEEEKEAHQHCEGERSERNLEEIRRRRKESPLRNLKYKTTQQHQNKTNISIVKFLIICHILQLVPSLVTRVHQHLHHTPIKWITTTTTPQLARNIYCPPLVLFAMADLQQQPQQQSGDDTNQAPDSTASDWLPVGSSPPKSDDNNNNNYDKGTYRSALDRLFNAEDLTLFQARQNDHDDSNDREQPISAEQTPGQSRPFDLFRTHPNPTDHQHQHYHHHHHHHHRHHNNHHLRHNNNNNHHNKPGDETHQKTERTRRHYTNDGYYESNGAADRPVVATRKGLVRGVTQKIFTGKFVDAFLGIPYAQPPIGRYRFRHPQPTNAWTGEIDASRMSNSCYQVNDTFFGQNFLGTSIWNANTPLNEDCLYLNIWTPFGIANTTVPNNTSSSLSHSKATSAYRPPDSNSHSSNNNNKQRSTAKRPVLVWIFGGGFYSGTSSLALYEGGVLASEEDIIVVSMNYRVSALGFLYFGRPDTPGNAGMFDQLMALQWINDNIDQFGGDPNRVTIFGESAGAVSVALHLLSPLSRNLFSQAILQSGAATCPWGFKEPREIIANGLQLASLVNCPSNHTDLDAVVECLLRADPMTLVSQEVGQTKTILNFPFVPVVDGSFLVETPSESLIKSNFKQARILLGSNYDEGNSFLIYLPEFSICPTTPTGGGVGGSNGNGNGNGGSGDTITIAKQADLLLVQQRQQQQQQANNNEMNLDAGSSSSSQVNTALMGELSDQGSQPPIESLDLLAAGRQYPPISTHQQAAQPLSQSSSMAGSMSAAEAEAQHNLNLSDSKPCKPNEYLSLTRDDFLRVLREDLNPYAEHPVGKEAIVFEYTNWNNPHDSVSNYDALDKIVGDYYFTCHVNEFAQRYANAGNAVYMYYFKQRSSMSPWPKWMGVLHADEINFVFGEPLNQMFNYTAKEVELSRRMMRYWANFAKYGNPTKESDNVSMVEKWPEYADKRQYFELHGDFVRIGRGPRANQCAFWAHFLPKLLESFDQKQCPLDRSNPPDQRGIASLANNFNQAAPSQEHRSNSLLSNVPSSIIVSICLIIVLSIICLLVYAKRTDRRWRNQRAAASMNQQQREQQQAAAAAQTTEATTITTTTTTVKANAQTGGGQTTTTVGSGQLPAQKPLLANSTNPSLNRARQQQQPQYNHHHQQQQQQPQPLGGGMQLHNMRPSTSQFPVIGPKQQQPAAGAAPNICAEPPEQSALDMAQSAAARVTGSAAAAIAAAKFKMLRSNTLAAAFGRTSSADPEQQQTGADQNPAAPMDLLAMRTKDERIINTLSSGGARNRFN